MKKIFQKVYHLFFILICALNVCGQNFSDTSHFLDENNQYPNCGTDELVNRYRVENPEYDKFIKSIDKKIYNILSSKLNNPLTQNQQNNNLHPEGDPNSSGNDDQGYDPQLSSNTITIPVVVHVIYNDQFDHDISNSDIYEAIDDLNDFYAKKGTHVDPLSVDTKIQFRLASKDSKGLPTSGITWTKSDLAIPDVSNLNELKSLVYWNDQNGAQYMNIYVVKGYTDKNKIYPFAIAGIAPYGEFVTVRYQYLKYSTLPHEVGHYLFLKHTFENGCKNDNCLKDGDRVCDTPPVDVQQGRSSCNGRNSCHSDVPDLDDQINNIMDYSTCDKGIITAGQRDRMRAFLTDMLLVSNENLVRTGCKGYSETISIGKKKNCTNTAFPYISENKHFRTFILITRQELINQGWFPSSIDQLNNLNSLSFYVENLQDIITDFKISIANVDFNSMPQKGEINIDSYKFQDVFERFSYKPSNLGWNKHVFNIPFNLSFFANRQFPNILIKIEGENFNTKGKNSWITCESTPVAMVNSLVNDASIPDNLPIDALNNSDTRPIMQLGFGNTNSTASKFTVGSINGTTNIPYATDNVAEHIQMIVTREELENAGKDAGLLHDEHWIKALAFHTYEDLKGIDKTIYKFNMKMKHVPLKEFPNNQFVDVDDALFVYYGNCYPTQLSENIHRLYPPFPYNWKDNLLIDISFNTEKAANGYIPVFSDKVNNSTLVQFNNGGGWGPIQLSNDRPLLGFIFSNEKLSPQAKASFEKLQSDDLVKDFGMLLYPNPNNGVFKLKLSNHNSNAEVEVYDILGNLILKRINIKGEGSSFDLSNQPKGIYLIKVKIGGIVFNKKLIISN